MQSVTNKELENRFGFHPATDKTRGVHEDIRINFYNLATWMNAHLPDSREKSLAFTALQEAAMWSNGAVAIHQAPLEPVKQ